ncbi:reverse transcriptase domain-containing protein [Bacillus cereus]|nr:reverse transcriptase domain-containing protein [Bacillus cereus]MEC2745709.1 reverse transcriptase domain-containing protein [Bacillus cereus]MEC2757609.1 reverse transcriptase domain-containing protein [Bacillus cereus]MEC2830208.1 reverse transcriptase domain-containing protein [Bacillus cereus]
MMIPRVILDNLTKKSSKEGRYQHQRLYRNLYNKEFFFDAYSNIYAKQGNMTKGTDGKTIDGMSIQRIESLIEELKNESYQPNPSNRIYIDKKGSTKKRPLGIPSVDDKLVQEVMRIILEAIYEPVFTDTSHGFRANKSCHSALKQIQTNFTGVKWFIEGDIKGFFDNIDHHILINLLRKRIKDEKFINLIWKFLKAGYLEEWKFHNTFSGTPQGGIISPILSNIYLNELDMYMKRYAESFNKGKKRKRTHEYRALEWQLTKLKISDETWKTMNELEKAEHQKKIKELYKVRNNMTATDPFDQDFKRVLYTRYADDFLIGVIGSKADAEKIKNDIKNFLYKELNLELSEQKTLITHATKKKARFLSYDITLSVSKQAKRDKNGKLQRHNSAKVMLYVPKEKWVGKLVEKNMVRMKGNHWIALHRKSLTSYDDLEIISIYDSELRGFYEYYKIANNASVINKMAYFVEYSMYKTFASKYKTSMTQVIDKFSVNGIFTIKYETKTGIKHKRLISSFVRKDKSKFNSTIDTIPNTQVYKGRTSLISRLEAKNCEWCGATDVELEIHHVRKLKDLKNKKNIAKWEEHMIARNRKTLALCATNQGNDCHRKLHKGILV